MQRLLTLAGLTAALVGVGAGEANAASGLYGKLEYGAARTSSLHFNGTSYKMQTGYAAGAAIGHELPGNWSLEGQLNYSNMKFKSPGPAAGAAVNNYSLGVNIIRSFPFGSVVPYVGAGVSENRVNYHATGGVNVKDMVGGYNAQAGIGFKLSDKFGVYGEYRYANTFQDPKSGGTRFEYKAQSVSVGLRADF